MAVHENGLRTKPGGGAQRHGGVNAELSGGVGSGRYHAALIGLPTDHDGLAFERRIEELFDGDEESVHVDVEICLHWTGSQFQYDRDRRFPMNKSTIAVALAA